MSLFTLGRTHIPHRKNTAASPSVRMDAPKTVIIPVSQGIGAPSVPTVKVGDKVYVGTLIAEAGGYVGAPVHSSVSGTVKKLEPFLLSNGRSCNAVIIESDGEMTLDPSITPPVINDLDGLSAAVRASGLVGLGGAGFPASVKLDGAKKGNITRLIINCAECEPYITSDTRTVMERSEDIVSAVGKLCAYIPFEEVVIGVERNKPEAIEVLKKAFADNGKVRVHVLPDTYPQGAEKILIYNSTGLIVPEGGLPSDVGCIVMNITSVAFLGAYFRSGVPLVEKCVTVDGSAIKTPMNVICPIGTPVADLIAFTGGYSTEEVGKLLYGGPMMGVAMYTDADPVLKNTNAIVALDKKDSQPAASTACIHCGRCVAACPMGLNPTAFARAMKFDSSEERAERLTDAKIGLCMECGCCSYVCPAKRPLVETNRLAKADLRTHGAKK